MRIKSNDFFVSPEWRSFQWLLVMTGIMHLSLLCRGLILCDLVAVTAHCEFLHDVSLPQRQGSPWEGNGASFRWLPGQQFCFLLTVLDLLLWDNLEVLFKWFLYDTIPANQSLFSFLLLSTSFPLHMNQ